MTFFVTGGTGHAGSFVLSLLLKYGYRVRALYRPTHDRPLPPTPEVDWVPGDVSNTETLSASMHGMETLINIVSLGFGHAESIVRAAKAAGVRRAIFISTTAIFTQLNAKSKSVRIDAERLIEASGLQYTILRPTMIYDSLRDRNMWRLIQFMRYSPVIPIFGDGNSLQQPIHAGDVAQAVVDCLKSNATIGRSYNIAGKYPITYNQVIDTIAARMDKRIWKFHIPYVPVVAVMKFFERLHIPFPIKAEQVLRLNEDKSFKYEEARNDFGFQPMSFEEGIKMELDTGR